MQPQKEIHHAVKAVVGGRVLPLPLQAAVPFQIDQRPGQTAVVIFQQVHGLLVGDAAFFAEDLYIFNGVPCHTLVSFRPF